MHSQTSSDSGEVFASDLDMAPASPELRRSPRGHATPAVPSSPSSMTAKCARQRVAQLEQSLAAVKAKVRELTEETTQLRAANKAQEQLAANLSVRIAEERIQRSILRQEYDVIFALSKETQREAEDAVSSIFGGGQLLPINRDKLACIECPVCTHGMYEPKIYVECGHSICGSCEQKTSRLGPAHCPVCLILARRSPIAVHELATLLSIIIGQMTVAPTTSTDDTTSDGTSIPDGSQDPDADSIPDDSQDADADSIPDGSQDPDADYILDGSQDHILDGSQVSV
ncbi:hypothetical protein BKA62DRAFT_669495 [Auriculariales sp. MPI-PUGE-AT-0066]|nr:hypothetical protein BKA62DRAFT_669495 [Auriculariales sp. MPI-PUGE-AT-0066]